MKNVSNATAGFILTLVLSLRVQGQVADTDADWERLANESMERVEIAYPEAADRRSEFWRRMIEIDEAWEVTGDNRWHLSNKAEIIAAIVAKERAVAKAPRSSMAAVYEKYPAAKDPDGAFRQRMSEILATWIQAGDERINALNKMELLAEIVASEQLPRGRTKEPNELRSLSRPTTETSLEKNWRAPDNRILLPFSQLGEGRLSIDNGTESHAIVKMIEIASDKKMCSIYLGPKSSFSVTAVPDGVYKLIFGFGGELLRGMDSFVSPVSCSEFEDRFRFSTTSTQSTIWEITLHEVVTGNAEQENISIAEFDKY